MWVKWTILVTVSICLCYIPVTQSTSREVNLITFFDCSVEDNLTTLEEVEQCDLFAYVGAEVAKDRLNAKKSINLTLYQVKINSMEGSEVSKNSITIITHDENVCIV